MRDEHEHLMNDATGLPERLEVQIAPEQWWVVGARPNHAISLFAGEEFVLQFNPDGELRRAFANGVRVKADGGKLWRAIRAAQRGSMKLNSECFSQQEQADFVSQATSTLKLLANALNLIESGRKAQTTNHENGSPLGRVIADNPEQFLQRITHWANLQIAGDFRIAEQPHVTG